jgi:hypothetical protein
MGGGAGKHSELERSMTPADGMCAADEKEFSTSRWQLYLKNTIIGRPAEGLDVGFLLHHRRRRCSKTQ